MSTDTKGSVLLPDGSPRLRGDAAECVYTHGDDEGNKNQTQTGPGLCGGDDNSIGSVSFKLRGFIAENIICWVTYAQK